MRSFEIDARDRPVRRDDGDVEFVDVVELVRFGLRRAGHAGELLVKPEIILDRDRGERLRLAIDLHAFLRLDGLVQAVAPAAARHVAAGVFVDDDDLVFLDDVLRRPSRKGSRRAATARCCGCARPGWSQCCLRVRPWLAAFSSSLSVGSRSMSVNSRDQIRQHERVGIVRIQKGAALFAERSASCDFSSMREKSSSFSAKSSSLRVSW